MKYTNLRKKENLSKVKKEKRKFFKCKNGIKNSLVSRGSIIHRLHLCGEVRPSPNECHVTQSAGTLEYNDCISAEG